MTRIARRRLPISVWVVTLAVPLTASAIGVGLQLAWLPELPDAVVVHWGVDGPDGFAAPGATIWLSALLGLGLPALFTIILAAARSSQFSIVQKLLACTSAASGVMVAVLTTASLGVQRGLVEASAAPSIAPWVAISAACALAVGLASWFSMPAAQPRTHVAESVEAMPLTPGERTVWLARTRISTGAAFAIIAAIVIASGAVALAIAMTAGATWPLALVPLLLLCLAAIAIAWTVRVDPSGLVVRSAPLGVPAVRIPVRDIARVETVQIEPLADFGGWGWRWGPGRGFGVIARAGEALDVERRDGRRFVVTVDDASTAAALLAAYAQLPAES
ncbi:DUF1648 domain-containing protein [Homoserinibacter sp. GY 40078]|uniref:DUF1648 domain-containing protein n=1 Tax=Homoserinibacter sp. GY 40078 TaxID=2603275 RepID=UPI0011CC1C80|nr:DUF1648 domain-containing protein [Homoserinibacter sp. GY 40078]TXK19716.1 DUF1648 domain-containing protein [Homoserinibacter sp. GY 40078]